MRCAAKDDDERTEEGTKPREKKSKSATAAETEIRLYLGIGHRSEGGVALKLEELIEISSKSFIINELTLIVNTK